MVRLNGIVNDKVRGPLGSPRRRTRPSRPVDSAHPRLTKRWPLSPWLTFQSERTVSVRS